MKKPLTFIAAFFLAIPLLSACNIFNGGKTHINKDVDMALTLPDHTHLELRVQKRDTGETTTYEDVTDKFHLESVRSIEFTLTIDVEYYLLHTAKRKPKLKIDDKEYDMGFTAEAKINAYDKLVLANASVEVSEFPDKDFIVSFDITMALWTARLSLYHSYPNYIHTGPSESVTEKSNKTYYDSCLKSYYRDIYIRVEGGEDFGITSEEYLLRDFVSAMEARTSQDSLKKSLKYGEYFYIYCYTKKNLENSYSWYGTVTGTMEDYETEEVIGKKYRVSPETPSSNYAVRVTPQIYTYDPTTPST